LLAADNLNTLIDYRYQQHFRAQNGRGGAGRNKTGAYGHGHRHAGPDSEPRCSTTTRRHCWPT